MPPASSARAFSASTYENTCGPRTPQRAPPSVPAGPVLLFLLEKRKLGAASCAHKDTKGAHKEVKAVERRVAQRRVGGIRGAACHVPYHALHRVPRRHAPRRASARGVQRRQHLRRSGRCRHRWLPQDPQRGCSRAVGRGNIHLRT